MTGSSYACQCVKGSQAFVSATLGKDLSIKHLIALHVPASSFCRGYLACVLPAGALLRKPPAIRLLSAPVNFSTHFSGIGCAEQAARNLVKAFHLCSQKPVSAGLTGTETGAGLKIVSCCEVNRNCQQLLASQVEHMFSNIGRASRLGC